MINRQFLSDHMNYIHIVENVIPHFNKMKSNAAKIADALSSYDILRIYNVFSFVRNVTPEQIDSFARKKYPSKYKFIKLKTGNERMVKLLVSYYSALLTFRDESEDPQVKSQASDAIKHTDEAIDVFKKFSKGNIVSVIGVAQVIGHLVKASVFAVPFLKISGKTFMPACIMLLSLAVMINMFMTAKKEHKKVID
jgi:hypothetical protein